VAALESLFLQKSESLCEPNAHFIETCGDRFGPRCQLLGQGNEPLFSTVCDHLGVLIFQAFMTVHDAITGIVDRFPLRREFIGVPIHFLERL
jgi:hypothetical protein